jgi:hypothetical protein
MAQADGARERVRAGQLLLGLQAGYYVATGLWPLASRTRFESVTGPKEDYWLVQTVGLVVSAVGAGLAVGLRRRGVPATEMRFSAAVTAAGLAAIDVVYVAKRRIRPVYAFDALLEAVFLFDAVAELRRRGNRRVIGHRGAMS